MDKKRVAIFASGSGSNAMNLIQHFKGHSSIEVAFVLTNNSNAGIIEKAEGVGVKTIVLSNADVAQGEVLRNLCNEENISWVVLAGYLRLVPADFIDSYENRIINLHPALLPKFGGKGMFGQHVHRAVVESGETESGITIHFVNSEFDKGRIIAQFRCSVNKEDTASDVDRKIRVLEQSYLPTVVEKTILNSDLL
jgi:phosphoribosylglycinamide formyltransferase-1